MDTSKGYPLPLGATLETRGVNFALFSKNATRVTLALFGDHSSSDDGAVEEITLDPQLNRTGDIWHIFVKNATEGQMYGYRVDGDYSPEDGFRFNYNKLLLDPYALAITGNYHFDRPSMYGYEKKSKFKDFSFSSEKNIMTAPRGRVVDKEKLFAFDGTGPKVEQNKMVIYEVHLKGFTAHSSSKVSCPGTYRGFMEKIPYLKELGVTSIELMPIQEFNPKDFFRLNPVTKEPLIQYWGYNPLNFFAPARHYCADENDQVKEFKELVNEIHQAGMEVILDVVYNHTGEGNVEGPTLCFRGIDNDVYYMLDDNRRYYKNYSGCGNTFNCNLPVVKHLIIDSLRFWYNYYKVDGFRFDLAAILGRNPKGEWIGENSIINDILNDPLLSGCKLIAEGWDAGGLYLLGSFPEGWGEWNGMFRDTVRRFLKGDEDEIKDFIEVFLGSPNLYAHYKSPDHSVNFVCAHDGFTLRDLVSYNGKHNTENGENNRDGMNENDSYNWGVEGETRDSRIIKLRKRMAKNFLAVLFLARGTPMLLSGDEVYRTQKGNNNAYCHDVDWNWFDWGLVEENKDIFRFCKKMIRFRQSHPLLTHKEFFSNSVKNRIQKHEIWGYDISFHGVELCIPDLSPYSHSIAFLLNGQKEITGLDDHTSSLYIIVNTYWEKLSFELPESYDHHLNWYLKVDTFRDSPEDVLAEPALWPGGHALVEARSIMVFVLK